MFPSNPATGQQVNFNGITYEFDGSKWIKKSIDALFTAPSEYAKKDLSNVNGAVKLDDNDIVKDLNGNSVNVDNALKLEGRSLGDIFISGSAEVTLVCSTELEVTDPSEDFVKNVTANYYIAGNYCFLNIPSVFLNGSEADNLSLFKIKNLPVEPANSSLGIITGRGLRFRYGSDTRDSFIPGVFAVAKTDNEEGHIYIRCFSTENEAYTGYIQFVTSNSDSFFAGLSVNFEIERN